MFWYYASRARSTWRSGTGEEADARVHPVARQRQAVILTTAVAAPRKSVASSKVQLDTINSI